MNDALEILAIGFSTALVFSLPFAFVAFLRYMRYKERVALARQGIVPQSAPPPANGRNGVLRLGILIGSVGLALSCSLFTGLAVFALMSGTSGPGLVLLVTPLAFLVLLPLFFITGLIIIYRLNSQSAVASAAEDPIPPQKL